MGRGRATDPRVPGYPREDAARRLDYVQHKINARRRAAWSEEVRQRRAAAAGRLRGDEKTGEVDSAAGRSPHPRSDRVAGATLRGDGEAGRSGRVAEGTGSGQGIPKIAG